MNVLRLVVGSLIAALYADLFTPDYAQWALEHSSMVAYTLGASSMSSEIANSLGLGLISASIYLAVCFAAGMLSSTLFFDGISVAHYLLKEHRAHQTMPGR